MAYLRQQSYLTQGISVKIYDKRVAEKERAYGFLFDGGLVSYIKFLNRGKEVKNEMPFYVNKENGDTVVEIAVQYTDSYKEHVFSFANNISTPEGGMHEAGFRAALTRVVNSYAKKTGLLKEKDENYTAEDLQEGLTAVIRVKLRNPQFEGQTKAKLGNGEIRGIVSSVMGESLAEYLEAHPNNAKAIISKVRGKLVNVEKATLDKVVKSDTLKPIIIALGAGIGDSFDISRLRYHKVIIMADADVDGSHIRTLLLTFFYRYFEPLIRNGHIYIAQPPLYRLQKGKDVNYAFTDQGRDKIIEAMKKKSEASKKARLPEGMDKAEKAAEKNPEPAEEIVIETDDDGEVKEEVSGITIQRYKGLGEMNPTQLWETTMDPTTRMMMRVNIEDAEAADKMFDILMGTDVEPRRHFIQTHAKSVKNLDV